MRTSMEGSAGALAIVAAAALAACGGGGGGFFEPAPGGGGGAGSGATAPIPTSGIYAVTVTSQGPSGAPSHGLSLVHPSAPDAEFVIEPPSAGLSRELSIVSTGVVNAGSSTVTELKPYAAVYISSGEVRRVSLVADGAAPASRVQRSGSTGACRFVLAANDYATPEQSRHVVSTVGSDGVCDTADDGQAEVVFTSSGGLTVTGVSTGRRLGVVRDPATLAPQGWFTTNDIAYWAPAARSLPIQAPVSGVVINTTRSALVETRGALSVFDVISTGVGTGVTETQLNAGLTAGTGWRSAGFDATDYYVYRSGSTVGSSSWSVLRINRSTKVVTQLATGTGVLASVGLGTAFLYATESTTASNRVVTISKTLPGPATTLQSVPASTLLTVVTGSNGRHQLWERPSTGTAGYSLRFISEAGGPPLLAVTGGYPLAQVESSTLNLATSETRDRFVFATGYGAAGLSGSRLQGYDAATGTSEEYGILPGTSRFGADPVLVGITPTPGPFLAGYAARSVAGGSQSSDPVAFSFDVRTAGTLRLATSKR